MRLAIMIVLMMSFCLAGFALADDPVGGAVRSGDALGLVYEGSRDFVEGWNVDQAHADNWTYAAPCMGPEWVASTTYTLERIELMAGGLTGTVTIEIRADDGSGCPTGEVLSSGSFEQAAELGWQGCDMEPVVLNGGMVYHMLLMPVVDSVCSFAIEGVFIPHCWSWDCSVWEGPSESFNWMAKFFGSPPVADENTSWTRVKALYR
jgi:hypothetical protein